MCQEFITCNKVNMQFQVVIFIPPFQMSPGAETLIKMEMRSSNDLRYNECARKTHLCQNGCAPKDSFLKGTNRQSV